MIYLLSLCIFLKKKFTNRKKWLTQCWLHWGHLNFIYCNQSNLIRKCNPSEESDQSTNDNFIALYKVVWNGSEPSQNISWRWVIFVERRRFYFIPFTKTHKPTTESYLQKRNIILTTRLFYSYHCNTVWVWTIFYTSPQS